MKKNLFAAMLAWVLVGLVSVPVSAQLSNCENLAFSTEEDFVTQGPEPVDGNPIISDGDLLGAGCAICLRNADLTRPFGDVTRDLGLDAADVIDVEHEYVAFSTELDWASPLFTAGDLLITNGSIIPNIALMYKVTSRLEFAHYDLGLDAVHFVGNRTAIINFLNDISGITRAQWVANPDSLAPRLDEFNVDIWFSTEGTGPTVTAPAFLDGDLLSARYGTVVQQNATLLPRSVPAGIPSRGVDFGLDAFTADREGGQVRFSTEILYNGEALGFTDGDVLVGGTGVVETTNDELIRGSEPLVDFLGLDALYKNLEQQGFVSHLLNLLLDDED